VGSYEGNEGSSGPRGRERRLASNEDPGLESDLRRRGEAKLEEQKRSPSSDNHQGKRAATDQMDKSRKGRQPQPKNLTSSYELTLAFRHSERQEGVGFYEGKEGSSEPRGRERGPASNKDPGLKSCLRRRGEAELEEQKGSPSSDNHQGKRAATDHMDESRKGQQPQPKNLAPSYELTSAFRHSERLNEQRELVEKVSGKQASSWRRQSSPRDKQR
jgi:hypothetical protein